MPLLVPDSVSVAVWLFHWIERNRHGTSYLRLCCLLAVAALPSHAASSDPYQKPLVDDTRLSRAVEIEAEGISVGEFLSLLSEKADVELSASRVVADEKIVLFIPARPLGNTLADLAALLGTQWQSRRDGSGKPTYKLVRDLGIQRYEAALLQRYWDRPLRLAEMMLPALGETAEQLAQRPEADPVRQAMSSEIARTAVTAYAALNTPQRQVLRRERCLVLPFALLPEYWKVSLRQCVRGVLAHYADLAERVPDAEPPPPEPADFDALSIRFSLHNDHDESVSLDVMMDIVGRVGRLSDSHDPAWLLPTHGDPFARTPFIPPGVDRVPAHRAEIPWIENLRRLAQATRRPVLADFYRTPLIGVPSGRKPEAESEADATPASVAAMDAFCRPVGYLWWTRDQALLLRKRDWFFQRQFEVPDRWLLDMASRMRKQAGKPRVGDLMLLLELTPQQIAGLNFLSANAGMTFTPDEALGSRETVRLLDTGIMSRNASIFFVPWAADPTPIDQSLPYELKAKYTALVPTRMSGYQRKLLAEMITALAARRPSAEPAVGLGLLIRLLAFEESGMLSEEEETRRYYPDLHTTLVQVEIRAGEEVDFVEFALPHSLPGDRRSHTRVVLQ